MRAFRDLVAEGTAVPTDGWDFSWFAGRATEQRPSWGYAALMGARMARATSALDVQTGRGAAGPHGGRVVEADGAALPFRDASFELVVSRHPVRTRWTEVARVLRPGGTFLSQQVGEGTMRELAEAVAGPQGPATAHRSTGYAVEHATAAGLTVTDLRDERLRVEFFDIAAVVHFLRKVVWTVPGFDVGRHRDGLAAVDRAIRERGVFVAQSRRFLIEARR